MSDEPRAAVPDQLIADEKQALRRQLLNRRGERTTAERAAAQAANDAHVLDATGGTATVCAFVPLTSEPLSAGYLQALLNTGCRVLVPVITGSAPLDWVDYGAGAVLVPGPLGIAHVEGRRLGAGAIATAAAVLVPALAIDERGCRLGRGGGHYDRSLALVAGTTERRPMLIGVIFDDERLPLVPTDHFDVPVDQVISPNGGVQPAS